jgi:hypothetical protein
MTESHADKLRDLLYTKSEIANSKLTAKDYLSSKHNVTSL